ncbi:MAG TPA: hypothetical protein VFI49_12595 [Rudaea sp.]|nr:hypothetical protein [Rudaea sp.]
MSRRSLVACLIAMLLAPRAHASGSDVVVVRVGDGSAALGSSSLPVFLERRASSGGLVAIAGNPYSLPTAAQGGNFPFTLSGSGTGEGGIALSANRHFLALAGYATPPGTATVASTFSLTVNRLVARIDSSGIIDTTTRFDSAFSMGSVRGAVSADDGQAFWASGASGTTSGGAWYVSLGSSGSATQICTNPGSMRAIGIVGGQLFADAAAGAYFGVFTIGSGLPTAASQAATVLPGLSTTAGPSPYGFVFFDTNASVAGLDTLYIADDRQPVSNGGIQKWTFNGTTWTFAYTLNNGLSKGVRGLAGERFGRYVVLYATTADAAGGGSNDLVRVVDDGTSSAPFSVLATAAANTVYRGVALAWDDEIFNDNFD